MQGALSIVHPAFGLLKGEVELVTTAEVVLRIFRVSLTGAYDIVKIAAAITIAAALPYTTAIKGRRYLARRLRDRRRREDPRRDRRAEGTGGARGDGVGHRR